MVKALLVSEYFPPRVFGGGEISAEHLARGLAEKGLDVSVLTSKFHGLKKFEEREGVRIYRRLSTGRSPTSMLRRRLFFRRSLRKELEKLDREENFDVVHFLNTSSIIHCEKRTIATINGYGNFCPKGNLFYRERGVCSGCGLLKFPVCILGSEYAGKIRLRPWFKFNPIFWDLAYWNFMKRNRVLGGVDEFIAISGFIKGLLLKNGIPEGRIHGIPNVISMRESGKDYPLDIRGPVITYAGALEKIKGVDLLVEAFGRIDNASLLIVGDGSERQRLESIANDRVRFVGNVGYEYMPSIYKQSDIIVLPSRWPEPLPRVLIEALYFGKPLIATEVGGNPECINGKNGFLVKHSKELSEGLERLISDRSLRERMGRESRRLFDERFDSERVIESVVNLYTR